ncbi:hypothetical protein Taro_055981 [Colocasia esculenta]|uniref:Uncharacterized protein n=1 Tax=Colocasia esculenta TaxID=4460 RepID=A0A843XUZ4_COLES|nr:hypothetical protein [Colocasia esculenta]
MACKVASTLYAPDTRQCHSDRKDNGQRGQKSSRVTFRCRDKNTTPTPIAMRMRRPGTNISCKGSVDTTINGVDTMAQSKGRNVKKRSSSVDTSPGQVDTRVRFQRIKTTGFHLRSTLHQIVDTRDLSQGIVLPVWDSVSTHLKGRSTHSGISVT